LKAELNTTLAALQALIEANSTSIASIIATNSELKTQLEALGVDVDSIMAGASTFNGDLTITTAAQLAFAKTLGDRVAKIDGNVTITLSTANGLTASDVDPVTSLIENVSGYVIVNTNASFNLSNLKSVSGLYSVTGKDINDSALESTGDVNLNYDGGYSQPNLKTAGKILLTNYATTTTAPIVVGTLSIDLSGLTVGTSVTTAITAHTSGGSHTSGGTLSLSGLNEGQIDAQDATMIKIGDASVTSVTTKDATEVHLGYDGTLASLTIDDAGTTATTQKLVKVFVSAKKITAALTADVNSVSGELHLTNATQVGSISSDALVHDLADLVYVGTGDGTKTTFVGGNISLTSDKTTTLPALKRIADITIPKVSSLTLPVATEAGNVTLAAATSFVADSAVVSSVDIADAGTLTTSGAVPATTVSVKSVGSLADLATLGTVTFKEQATQFALNSLTAATSITFNGKTGGASGIVAVVDASNAKLTSLTLGGKLSAAAIGAAPLLTTVSTSGTIFNFVMDGAPKVNSLTLDHTEDATLGAAVEISNNDKLTTFTTKVNRVTSFVVTSNPILESFNASSMTALPANTSTSVNYTIKIADNAGNLTGTSGGRLAYRTGLQGTYTGLTATTAEAFSQASLLTIKPYAVLIANAATATAPTAGALGADGSATFIYMNYEYGPSATSLGVAQIGTASGAATTPDVKNDLAALN
jgi:hypothetical protein